MGSGTAIFSAPSPPAGANEDVSPTFWILRDVARGGTAGAITGVLVAGIGGRVAMRLAALIVPDWMGQLTENGNRIGEITAGGTLGLIAFGLVVGFLIGALWVVVSPWLPRGWSRGIWAMPIALALGAVGFVDGANPDFVLLQHDPLVVAVLLLLVAGVGLVIALVDDVLDRRLPRSGSRPAAIFATLAAIGGVVTVPSLLFGFFTADQPRIQLGIAIDAVVIATIVWWILRLRGATSPPFRLLIAGRLTLLAVTLVGLIELISELEGALGTA